MALYGEGQSTRTKSTAWICWQGLDPSSTGKFNILSDDMLSPIKPEKDDAVGSIFTPTKFILLKVDLNSMSAELPLSTRIRNTFRPAMRKVTTMASVCGCHRPRASLSVKMMGSLERRVFFLCARSS